MSPPSPPTFVALAVLFALGAVTVRAVVIFGVQVLACQWWSRRFRFGHVEWLWRSLTCLEWQPLRLRNEPTPRAA